MKKLLLLILFSVSMLSAFAQAGNTWAQKADFGGQARYNAVGFSIGTKGYIGTGDVGNNTYTNSFWEYDQTTGTWAQKADFSGVLRIAAVGFSIGSKGYIGTGQGLNGNTNDFWEYDPATNAWTQKANFGGVARYGAVGFCIGTKGYIATGYGNGYVYTNDLWEYDPATDSWTQKANFGGEGRLFAVGFSTESKGYVGTGLSSTGNKSDFWEYDPATDTWAQKTDFQGGTRFYAVGFSVGAKGYIGTGTGGSSNNDFWEYDPATDAWTQKATFGGEGRERAVGFSLGAKGYVGTGLTSVAKNDFWEYTPDNANPSTSWTGAVSNEWATAGNWSNGVPTASFNAAISAGAPNMPVITTSAVCNDITVGSGATLTLSAGADLTLYGGFANAGTFTHTAGSITFGATAGTQTIPPLTYYNLSTTGLASKLLDGNATVNGTLTVTGNKLFVTGNKVLTLNGNLAGEGTANYVIGDLKKTTQITGAGSQSFGNMGLTFDNTGGGNWGSVAVTRTAGEAVTNPLDATQKSIARQWQIVPANTPGTAVNLTLTWLNADNNGLGFASGNAQVWRMPENGTQWLKVGSPQLITENGDLRSVTVQTTAFSTWTITEENTVLPVTWLSFTGQAKADGVHLTWTTAVEKNSEVFLVERSLDGKSFRQIKTVKAAGHSNVRQQYSFRDTGAPLQAGTPVYYRLNQVDLDKTHNYSGMIAVGSKQQAVTAVYPNPFDSRITLYLAGLPAAPADKVTIHALDGRQVFAKTLAGQDAPVVMLEDLPALPPGIYLLKVVVNNQLSVHRLIRK